MLIFFGRDESSAFGVSIDLYCYFRTDSCTHGAAGAFFGMYGNSREIPALIEPLSHGDNACGACVDAKGAAFA